MSRMNLHIHLATGGVETMELDAEDATKVLQAWSMLYVEKFQNPNTKTNPLFGSPSSWLFDYREIIGVAAFPLDPYIEEQRRIALEAAKENLRILRMQRRSMEDSESWKRNDDEDQDA